MDQATKIGYMISSISPKGSGRYFKQVPKVEQQSMRVVYSNKPAKDAFDLFSNQYSKAFSEM